MSASAKLWELGGELEQILALVADAGGEITPDIEKMLDERQGAFYENAEGVLLYICMERAKEAAAKQEEDRVAAIRRSHGRAADSAARYLQAQMERTGQTRIGTSKVRACVQRNGQPSIRWPGSLESLPEAYRRVTVAPDLARVREDLSAGAEIPDGFVVEYGSHLRIF